MTTADKLRSLRGQKSITQIAAEIGLTRSAWAMYERGCRVPRDAVKVKIANHFGKTVQELFFSNQ